MSRRAFSWVLMAVDATATLVAIGEILLSAVIGAGLGAYLGYRLGRRQTREDRIRAWRLDHSGDMLDPLAKLLQADSQDNRNGWYPGLRHYAQIGMATFVPGGGSHFTVRKAAHDGGLSDQAEAHLSSGFPRMAQILVTARRETSEQLNLIVESWKDFESIVVTEIVEPPEGMLDYENLRGFPATTLPLVSIVRALHEAALLRSPGGDTSTMAFPLQESDGKLVIGSPAQYLFFSSRWYATKFAKVLEAILNRPEIAGRYDTIRVTSELISMKCNEFASFALARLQDFEYSRVPLPGRCVRCIQAEENA